MNLSSTFKKPLLLLTLAFFLSTPVFSVSLDELMGEQTSSPENTLPPTRSTSESLLDSVEQERSSIKKQAFLKEYKKLKPELDSRCQCLRNNSCEKKWGSTNWNKGYGLLAKQRKGVKNIRKLCTSLNSFSRHISQNEMESQLLLAKASLKRLKKINSDLWDDNYFGKRQYDQEQAEAKEEREAKEFHAKRVARERRERKELDAAWKNSGDNFSDTLQKIQDQTMQNIYEHNTRMRKSRASSSSSESSTRRDDITSSPNTRRLAKQSKPEMSEVDKRIAEEKEYCISGGFEWNESGNSCNRVSKVHIKGWTEGNRAVAKPARSSSTESQSKTRNGKAGTTFTRGRSSDSAGKTQEDEHNQDNRSSKQEKKLARTLPISIQDFEGPNSWSTEKQACKYAIQGAVRKAESQCRKEHKGVRATTDDIGIPLSKSCTSCRKIKASWDGKKVEYKCIANIQMYCRLPN